MHFKRQKQWSIFAEDMHAQMHQIDTEEFNRMMKTSTLIRTLPPMTSQLYFAADISFSQYL